MIANKFVMQTKKGTAEMKDSLQDAAARTRRYWFVDGLSEMVGGGTILIIAVLNYFLERVGQQTWAALATLVFAALVVAALVGARWLIVRLKERITYPRTGYVAYRVPSAPQRRRRSLIAGVAAGLLGAGSALAGLVLQANVFYIGVGLLVALVTLYKGGQYGLVRFYLLAGVAVLLGWLIGVLNLAMDAALLVFLGGLAFSWMIAGAITLARYLHGTRAQADADSAAGTEEL
jgi:hypothetical protein